jgi:phosphonopyruvate decarboxylase
VLASTGFCGRELYALEDRPNHLYMVDLLLDNGVHDSTGGQATVSPLISFAEIAAACGYGTSLETGDVDDIAGWLDAPPADRARFARLLIRAGSSNIYRAL